MKPFAFCTLSLLVASTNAFAESYVPIVETVHYITSSKMTCNLHTNQDFDNLRDWCSADASVDLRVTVTQMRSVQSSTSKGVTSDAKIARFTIDANKPGTGFHLVDNLQQDHSWFQSWANRSTYIGPFASSYNLWVKNTNRRIQRFIKKFKI